MYIQITTKCNMSCDHCCYNCTMNGEHGDISTMRQAVFFALDYSEHLTIGGGEPTLHPDFFEILGLCLSEADFVWLATNGSNKKAMRRLANIIDGNDWESFDREDYCTCQCDCGDDDDECECYEECYCEPSDMIYQDGKLSVALSLDPWHDPIDPEIESLWRRRANWHNRSNFEIRDVSRNVIREGRAKTTGTGWEDGCPCQDFIIRPDGKIKMCGCLDSPVIGDIWNGIRSDYETIIEMDDFRDDPCFKSVKKQCEEVI